MNILGEFSEFYEYRQIRLFLAFALSAVSCVTVNEVCDQLEMAYGVKWEANVNFTPSDKIDIAIGFMVVE